MILMMYRSCWLCRFTDVASIAVNLCALTLSMVALDSFAGERVVQLESAIRLDTEMTEFRRIDLTGWNTVGMNLSFRFANAVSNNIEIAIECEPSATLPPWFYDANWNLVRLTKRGVSCDAVFKVEVVSSGVLFIVN